MFNFFFKRKPKPIPRLLVIPTSYTLEMWVKNNLSVQFEKMMEEKLLAYAISVLINQIPSGFPLRGQKVNDTQANIELGRINGYLECLHLLQSLGKPFIAPEQIEETYERENGNDNDE
jgi:hypothetical protein